MYISHSQHTVLRISDNSIGNKGMISMAEALSSWKHALKVLDLSSAHIHAKGIVALIVSFEKNFGMSLSVEELNLSHNNFGETGSAAFESWLSHVKAYSKLRKLSLAGTSVVLPALVSIRHLAHLTELDISGNKIDGVAGCSNIASLCEISSVLHKLNFSSCGLTKESLEPILQAIVDNIKLTRVEINLSSNDGLSNKGVSYVAATLAKSNNITGIDLSNIKLKETTVIEVLEAATAAKKLERLSLSRVLSKNSTTSKDKHTVPLVVALSVLPNENSNLKYLDVSGGYGKTLMLPFLETLCKNSSLLSLNISGNNLQDKGNIACTVVMSLTECRC
jgi:hypothetical protein